MVWYVPDQIRSNVPDKRMSGTVVFKIRLLSEFVPFAGKNTLPAFSLKSNSDAANTCE